MNFEITPKELKAKLDAGAKIIILDVREPDEFETCNLGGILMPLAEIPDRCSELDENAHIVVHCHHGGRSARAAKFLQSQGFGKVQNLAGGIDLWSQEIDSSIPRY